MKNFYRLVAILLIATGTALAQTDTARLSGSVLDSTGAAIPSATVTVKNTATGFVRVTKTNAAGVYALPGLPIGEYTETAAAPGFSSFTASVVLTVGLQATLDPRLGVTSSQTVIAEASGDTAINLTDSQVSTTITPREMIDLPSLTRDPYDFVALSGTANSDPNGSTARGVGFALNGQRAAGTEILLDGVENSDTYDAAVGQTIPIDSVEEYSIITNGFDAQYGRASGGVVNLATKSGTNSFHGSAYEFNRVSDLAANTFYEDAAGLPKDHFTRNQFGYSIGGPILHDRLFFFNNYEWNRIRSAGQQPFYIPSAAFLATTAANTQAFFAQYGKIAPSTKLGAVDPTTNFQLATVVAPINAGAGNPVNAYFGDSRVDFTLNNKISMFVRVATFNQTLTPGSVSLSPYAGYNTGETDSDQSYLFSLNYVISPKLLSSSKVSYARLSTQQPLGTAGIAPGLFLTKNGGTFNGISVALPGYGPTSPGDALPFGGPQNLYQFVQDFNYTLGKHTIKVGGQFIQLRDNRTFGAYEEASELMSATSSTATGIANLISGTVGSFEVALNPQGKLPCSYNANGTLNVNTACSITNPATSPSFTRENTFNDGDVYGEDQIKFTSGLTLTLGLRWEYYGVQHNTKPGLESNFYLGTGTNLAQQVQSGQVATTPNSPVGGLIAKDLNNFAPRVSFAYDVFGNGKTSLRGGYGIMYERDFGNVTYNVIQNPPNYAGVVVSNTPLTNSNFGPFGGATGSTALAPPSLRAVQQNIPTAYSQVFSLTVDHQISRAVYVQVYS